MGWPVHAAWRKHGAVLFQSLLSSTNMWLSSAAFHLTPGFEFSRHTGGEMINADGGDVAHAHQFGRFDPTMPGNDTVGSVNIGLINPNSLMLAWICLICLAV